MCMEFYKTVFYIYQYNKLKSLKVAKWMEAKGFDVYGGSKKIVLMSAPVQTV